MLKRTTILLFITSLFSCADYFEPRSVIVELPEHEPVLVVNGFINPDSVSEVSIARSTGFLDTPGYSFLANADVRLSENGIQVARLAGLPADCVTSRLELGG